MRYMRETPEYGLNCDSLREMEEAIPMTLSERTHFRKWVHDGNDVLSNPWKYFEQDGSSMNYLKAFRLRFGASHGEWDSWEYDTFMIPDGSGKRLIHK